MNVIANNAPEPEDNRGWIDAGNNKVIRELKHVLNVLSNELQDITRCKYNLRFAPHHPTPATKHEIRVLNERRRDICKEREELLTRIHLIKDPNWTKPVPKPKKPAPPKPHVIRALSLKKIDEVMSDACGICMETHTMRDGLHTACGHCFGAVCYEIYRAHLNRSTVPCPICRRRNTQVTTYRPRGKL